MITAKDVYKIIKAERHVDDAELDKFIEGTLVPRFLQADKNEIKVHSDVVNTYPLFAGKSARRIIDIFSPRGFRVAHTCEDRPAGNEYFIFEIPPQIED